MRLIIAGSRNLQIDYQTIKFLLPNKDITEIVTGNSGNVDLAGNDLSYVFLYKEATKFDADWNDLEHPEAVIKTRQDGSKYNAMAGPIRNRKMAEYADALLIIWDGESRGSRNMKQEMLALDKPVYEVILKHYNVE